MNQIHVMSTGGGTGKTDVSANLAKIIARQSGGSVLIIDADFTGVGFLNNDQKEWRGKPFLTDLILCPGDEYHNKLKRTLPVYCISEDSLYLRPDRLQGCEKPTPILFSPSNMIEAFKNEKRRDEIQQLHTLLTYEHTSGLITRVFKDVASQTNEILTTYGSKLSAVIIDHGAGIGSLQWDVIRYDRYAGTDVSVVLVGERRTAHTDANAISLFKKVSPDKRVVFVLNKANFRDHDETKRMYPDCVLRKDYIFRASLGQTRDDLEKVSELLKVSS